MIKPALRPRGIGYLWELLFFQRSKRPWLAVGIPVGFLPGVGSDEDSQFISDYLVSVDSPGLFTVLPDISNEGTLTFTPAIDRNGVANVNVQVRDSGGTSRGGIDLSMLQSFSSPEYRSLELRCKTRDPQELPGAP